MIKLPANKKIKVIILILIVIIFAFLLNSRSSAKKEFFNVGVVKIEGAIMESVKIIDNLNQFEKDENIHAIILNINSPGGAVVPSQEIYAKVNQISENQIKPIVASIGSLGASGGYYIAIGADKIVANHGSIVGSIGVIMSFPIVKDVFDKIGLKFETFKSGEFKDSGSPYRKTSLNDKIYFENIVQDLHKQFTKEVSIQRNIPLNKINLLANGKIFTGTMAYNNNLIDTLGTFEDALNITIKMTNIDKEIQLIYPDEDNSIFEAIFQSINSLKVMLTEFYNMPLYIMGGMYD